MSTAGQTIRTTLDQAKAFLAQVSPPKLSEADTKIYFIEPVIAALGWNGIGIVTREYYVKSSQEFIDYMMAISSQKLLAIEAKPLQSPLTEKNAAQLVQYCAIEGVEWAALTNGREVQFFNTFLKPDLNAKRVMNLELLDYSTDQDFERIVKQLSQLSRESITYNATHTWLRQKKMDITLRAALTDAGSAATKALRKALSDVDIKATAAEVAQWSSIHLSGKVDTPLVESRPPAPMPPVNLDNPNATDHSFDPKQSSVFQGDHESLLPVFEELQARVSEFAPEANWRAMKFYVAAADQGETFLAVKRRASTLVVGVTAPMQLNISLPEQDPSIFRWSRITRAFALSNVEEVTNEVINILQEALRHALANDTSVKHYFGVTLKQLIDRGFITPQEVLVLQKGEQAITEARLDESGKINWHGKLYSSPSDKVFAKATGRQSLNGWTSWFVRRDGVKVSLAELRQQVLA